MKLESLVERCTLALQAGPDATLLLDLNLRASGAGWVRLFPSARKSPKGRVLASKGKATIARFRAKDVLDFLIEHGVVAVVDTEDHRLVEKANELRYGAPGEDEEKAE